MINDLKKYAAARRQAIADRLDTALAEIEKEVKANEGIYPHNGGRLTQAEVCRRAKVRPATLQGPAHKDSTLPTLNSRLKVIQEQMVIGRSAVRAAVTEKIEAWKQAWEDLASNYHLNQLELMEARNALAEKDKHIRELEKEVTELRVQLSEGKIVPIRSVRREGSE